MPSSGRAIRAILTLLPHDQRNIFELGSGWGSLIFPIARRFPGSFISAFEISPFPFLFSKLLQTLFVTKNIQIQRKDFFKIDLNAADVIVCYLYPKAMLQLRDKFEAELKVGSVVISNCFAIPGWKPEKTVVLEDLWRTKIYFYRKLRPSMGSELSN